MSVERSCKQSSDYGVKQISTNQQMSKFMIFVGQKEKKKTGSIELEATDIFILLCAELVLKYPATGNISSSFS